MAVSEAGPPITRLDFRRGLHGGSHLVLYANCLVHRGDQHLETIPLAGIASARVAFERDARRLGWGVALVIVALILYVVAAPLAGLAASAAGEIASAGTLQGVTRGLHMLFKLLELCASLLPVVALAVAIGGIALAVLGWLGQTTLTVALAGVERAYPTRGRNTQLLDFAEALAAQLMLLKR